MRRALEHAPRGGWPAAGRVGAATLGFADRWRRRVAIALDSGGSVLLDLAEPTVLREGDGLGLEDGGWIEVHEAAEDVLDILGRDPVAAVTIAWHLGNRHLPVQVLEGGALRILHDHVIAGMLEGLGARVERRSAPFTPEAGAYLREAGHGHHRHRHGEDR
jgi:urease accessory protein